MVAAGGWWAFAITSGALTLLLVLQGLVLIEIREAWIGSIRQWRPSRETLAHSTTTPEEVLS